MKKNNTVLALIESRTDSLAPLNIIVPIGL